MATDVPHRTHPLWVLVAGWLFLGAVVALDSFLFDLLFDENYVRWYVENGTAVGLISGFVVLTLDLDRHPSARSLVSLNAIRYLAGWIGVLANFQISWAVAMRAPGREQKLDQMRLSMRSRAHRIALSFIVVFDMLMGAVIAFLAMIAAAIWLLVIVPFQYFVFMICGAPSRLAESSSEYAYVVEREGIELTVADKSNPIPEDAVPIGISTRPVAVTNFFAVALLGGVSILYG
jgi:hypothetical protein